MHDTVGIGRLQWYRLGVDVQEDVRQADDSLRVVGKML
jgi:hypothetical protein